MATFLTDLLLKLSRQLSVKRAPQQSFEIAFYGLQGCSDNVCDYFLRVRIVSILQVRCTASCKSHLIQNLLRTLSYRPRWELKTFCLARKGRQYIG